tara:strand:- start:1144 stop:1419 length:276 start_codon:yes stop_codon:yes gene_type:complete
MNLDKKEPDTKLEKEDVVWLNDTKKSRDIVLEILRFGVTQPQIKFIIGLLALELEDREMMLGIKKLVDEEENTASDSQKSKIIYPGGNEDE